ncbi:MAG: cystathionine gamma-synthase [SAR86 cluster bacterium]|jgi:cystathionine gamma-synthase|nr:cystathionine gamma-synthase [SAR86 cluster bacterium]
MKLNISKNTIAIRTALESDEQYRAVIPPIYLTSTFAYKEIGVEQRYDYTRSANPTRDALAEAVSVLEGGFGATVTSSGMAATTLVTSLLNPNDYVIVPHDCYGGTFRLFSQLAERGLLQVKFIDQSDINLFQQTIKQYQPKIVWVESPSNPLLRVVDIQDISKILKQSNTLLVVDNTFLTPIFQTPFKLGADIVIHSTTKYINGHSDVVGGIVVAKSETLHQTMQEWANTLGLSGSPFDSYMTLRGLRTLKLRMKAHEKTAHALARVLSEHPSVEKVYYPGLSSHPSHAIAKKQQSGFGGMLSFEIKGGLREVKKFFKRIEYFSLAESLGGVESLVCHPYTMTHAPLSSEDKKKAGISENLIRISVGIEEQEDLIKSIQVAIS